MRKLLGHAIVGVVASLTTYFVIRKYTPASPAVVERIPSHPIKWEIHPPADFTTTAQIAMPAVVHIKVTSRSSSTWNRFFAPELPDDESFLSQNTGSGVIISADGYIITSNHVIENASNITVTLYDNQSFRASIVGTDPSTDLALLKINAEDLPYLEYGDSDQLKVGDWVLAVGNPFNLTSTVTAGIVSAKGRSLNLLRDRFRIESFIQTDAAVNPGNSGGALVNIEGKLVGINTAIASMTGTFAGYSFAVPVNIVKKVVEDLQKYGKVQRALLGVSISNVTPELQKDEELAVSQGAYVQDVYSGSAAEEAGLRNGDVIIAIEGRPIHSAAELQEMIGRYRPGDKVRVTFYRKSERREATVRLKGRSSTEVAASEPSEATLVPELGAEIRPLTAQEKQALEVEHGLKVVNVWPGRLQEVGVRPGYVITAVDKVPVSSLEDLRRILAQAEGGLLIEGLYSKKERAYYAISVN